VGSEAGPIAVTVVPDTGLPLASRICTIRAPPAGVETMLDAVITWLGPVVMPDAQDTVEVVLMTSALPCAEHAELPVASDWNCACSTTL
jgi:hypothetical protein